MTIPALTALALLTALLWALVRPLLTGDSREDRWDTATVTLLAAGIHANGLRCAYDPDHAAEVTIWVDGREVASCRICAVLPATRGIRGYGLAVAA